MEHPVSFYFPLAVVVLTYAALLSSERGLNMMLSPEFIVAVNTVSAVAYTAYTIQYRGDKKEWYWQAVFWVAIAAFTFGSVKCVMNARLT